MPAESVPEDSSDKAPPKSAEAPRKPAEAPQKPADDKPATAWMIPLITAATLAAAFCAYYFIYVGARRADLANRNFRALALLGEQFQQSVSILDNVLDFSDELLGLFTTNKKAPGHVTKLDADSFLIVHPEDARLDTKDKQREALKDYLQFLAPGFELKEITRESSKAAAMHVERRSDGWQLVLRSFQHSGTPDKDYQGSLPIDDIMNPLVGSMPFDDILLVSQEGFIVYQSKQTGPRFTTLSSLLQSQIGVTDAKPDSSPDGSKQLSGVVNRNADPVWRSRPMHLTEVMLAGTRYKLFLQPVLLSTFIRAEARTEPPSEWVLCGLRSSSTLEWEALSLSYTFFIWFTVVFFIIWTSYKVLKIFLMNHRERLRIREFGALAVSLVLLTSVLTLSLLQLDFHLNDDTETRLQRLGQSISNNLHEELRSMRAQLTEWCGSNELAGDLDRTRELIRNSDPDEARLKGRIPISATPRPSKYPFLTNAFWTDDDGHQIVKWSTTQYVTPMIDVSGLPLFTRPTAHLDRDADAFGFASILPPNKLEYLGVFNMKTGACAAVGGQKHPWKTADLANGFAFLSSQPLSLIDPILPYGYGFALVDQTGAVLFHSDKTRNGRENFLLETGDNKELYAAVISHKSQRPLAIKYHGQDYRALVLPIENVTQAPWSLIVFRDVTEFRTLNLQVMTLSSTLLFLVLGGPLLIAGMGCAVLRPRFAPEWLWPNRRRLRTYLYQINCYALLIALFLVIATLGSSEAILIACFVAPYAALLITVWCIRAARPAAVKPYARIPAPAAAATAGAGIMVLIALALKHGHWQPLAFVFAAIPVLANARRPLVAKVEHWLRAGAAEQEKAPPRRFVAYRTCYLGAALMLLLLFGVLIPMALFRTSLDAERRLAIKQAQFRLTSAYAERWTSIVKQHDDDAIGEAAWQAFLGSKEPWRWIVPDNLTLDNRPPAVVRHSDATQEHFAGWFRRLLYWFHHDYNDPSAEMLAVIPDRGNPSDWSWEDRDSTIALRWHGAHPGRDKNTQDDPMRVHGDLLLTSAAPAFSMRDGLTYMFTAALVMLIAAGLVWPLSRKLFLFHVAPLKMTGTRQIPESLREGRNVLILVPPVSDWELDIPKEPVDVSTLKTLPEWNEANRKLLATPPNLVIELRHFEFVAADPEVANQKFVLLERLLKRENTQVAVVMTVPASSEDYRRKFPEELEVIDLRDEPFSWLEQYKGPAQDLIWKECGPLPALWPLGAQLAKDLKSDGAHTADTIASEILERADGYYQMIWDECSPDQKFVLSQLAADGVLNPTNGRAIRQLIRRGLITKDPQFRIMNESFRRFLRSATTPQLKQQWLHESRLSGWGRAHGAFFTTMTLLGVFLLATQNSLWQSAAAYVTTALGGLGTLTKLFDMLRGKVTPEKS